MAAEGYEYQLVGGSFPNDQVDIPNLIKEIRAKPEITIALSGNPMVTVISDVAHVSIPFKDSLTSQSPNQKPFLDAVVAAHTGEPTQSVDLVQLSEAKTPEGIIEVVNRKSFELPSQTLVSIDYGNKRTWWMNSERHTDDLIAPEPDGKTYSLPDNDIINVYEITDGLTPTHMYDPEAYRVKVKKNGVDITHLEEGFEAGMPSIPDVDRYSVDYVNGTVVFVTNQSSHEIRISYSEPKKGMFRIESPPGKQYRLNHLELQFSAEHDPWPNPMEFVVGMNNPAMGGVDIEAVVKTYRGMRDILNFANLGTAVPPAGEFSRELYQIPFNYISGFTIIPMGAVPTKPNTMNYMELRLKYDKPLTNIEVSSASFYMFVEDYDP